VSLAAPAIVHRSVMSFHRRGYLTSALLLAVSSGGCRKHSAALTTPPATGTASAIAAEPKPHAFDTSCRNDADCTPAPACCPAPCTSDVINVKEVQRARDALVCDHDQQCPVAGSCITHQYLCVANTCRLVFVNDADYRPQKAAP